MTVLLAGAPVFESTAKTVYVLARLADYIGTAIFVGGLAFVALLWPEGSSVGRVKRILVSGWLLAAFGTVAAIGLEGAWIRGGRISNAANASTLKAVLATDFGREWASKALLWVLAGVVLIDLVRRGESAARSLPWRVSVVAITLGIVRIAGLTGHGGDTRHPIVAQIADLVHLSAMTVWVGGLVMLLVGLLPRHAMAELQSVIPRYSIVAMSCVIAIVSSGLMLAWQVVGGPSALLGTTYGRLLLLKIALLTAVMGAALASKNWVQHRLVFATVLRGDRATVRPFVLSVATETVLVLLVLSAASFLVTANPGR